MAIEKSKQKSQSLWQEIVYFAKLMRSIILYHYRHEEASDKASWRSIFITAGIGAGLSAIVTLITLTIFRFYELGGTVMPRTAGFAIVLNWMPVRAFQPPLIVIELIFFTLLSFAVMILLAYIIGICLQLWFGETESDTRQELLVFIQIAIGVKSVYLIPIQLITAIQTDNGMRFIDTPLRLFTVYNDHWLPNYIPIAINFLSVALPIYGYYVLYRFLRSREGQVKNFWRRFLLIVVITHGLSFVVWQQARALLNPLYIYILSHIL